jgi:hypothetical protein
MRFTVLSVGLAFLIAGSAHGAPSPGGLKGVVTRGPIAPVCTAEGPCSEPARNVTLVFSRKDHVAGRALTDILGRYRLRLPAGLYSVRRAAASGIDRRLEPNRVRVYAGRFTRVDFSIDTGIR